MVSRSCDYVEYCRETATHLKSLHDLALRGRRKEAITASIHRRIVGEVGLAPEDDLVDIGCGDGTLLRMAGQIGVRSAVGFLAADEEVACVKVPRDKILASSCEMQQAHGNSGWLASFVLRHGGRVYHSGLRCRAPPVRHWRHEYSNTRNNSLFTKAA